MLDHLVSADLYGGWIVAAHGDARSIRGNREEVANLLASITGEEPQIIPIAGVGIKYINENGTSIIGNEGCFHRSQIVMLRSADGEASSVPRHGDV